MSNFIWPGQFTCTLLVENTFVPNSYTIYCNMETIDHKKNIGLGFRKLKYFIEHHLSNSILIFQDNPKIKNLEGIKNTVIKFPTEPWDYLIGTILYWKFTAITEKYFTISSINIDSALGEHVQYHIDYNLDIGVDIKGEHWWNQDSPGTDLNDKTSWEKLNLKDIGKFSPRIIEGGLKTNGNR